MKRPSTTPKPPRNLLIHLLTRPWFRPPRPCLKSKHESQHDGPRCTTRREVCRLDHGQQRSSTPGIHLSLRGLSKGQDLGLRRSTDHGSDCKRLRFRRRVGFVSSGLSHANSHWQSESRPFALMNKFKKYFKSLWLTFPRPGHCHGPPVIGGQRRNMSLLSKNECVVLLCQAVGTQPEMAHPSLAAALRHQPIRRASPVLRVLADQASEVDT